MKNLLNSFISWMLEQWTPDGGSVKVDPPSAPNVRQMWMRRTTVSCVTSVDAGFTSDVPAYPLKHWMSWNLMVSSGYASPAARPWRSWQNWTPHAEFWAEVEVSPTEIKTAISNLQAKSPSVNLSPENNSKHSDVELNSKLDMEFTISAVPKYVSPNMNTKPKYGDVVMYENENVGEILKSLGDDKSSITNIRRLGKFNLDNHIRRSLLVTFNNPWVVHPVHIDRKNTRQTKRMSLLIDLYRKKINKKDCLSKRWKLICEENYDKSKFRIINLKWFYNGNEISTKENTSLIVVINLLNRFFPSFFTALFVYR